MPPRRARLRPPSHQCERWCSELRVCQSMHPRACVQCMHPTFACKNLQYRTCMQREHQNADAAPQTTQAAAAGSVSPRLSCYGPTTVTNGLTDRKRSCIPFCWRFTGTARGCSRTTERRGLRCSLVRYLPEAPNPSRGLGSTSGLDRGQQVIAGPAKVPAGLGACLPTQTPISLPPSGRW